MELRVLTWNLMHGRAVPPAGRYLLEEFASALGRWEWDVALLQEVPPWWPDQLGPLLGASTRAVLTSRNALLSVRRGVAVRWPDLIKSNGGGCNAILVRGHAIAEHRSARLRRLPERRWVHAVCLESGLWVANLHAGGTLRECRRAALALLRWSDAAPAVLGGDFNVPWPSLPGFQWAGGLRSDHVLAHGLSSAAYGMRVLDRAQLSDHAPVLVTLGEL